MAERFFSTCSVCCSMPPSIRLPVAGSKGTCPEIKTNPLVLMACEYGPIGLGALGLKTMSRVKLMMASEYVSRKRIADAEGSGARRDLLISLSQNLQRPPSHQPPTT